jgi:hypothetical protein
MHDLKRLRQYLARMNEQERELLMSLAGRMATRTRHGAEEGEKS